MSGRSKVSVQPINIIFRHLQQQTRVSLWLYDNVDFRIEGKIIVSRPASSLPTQQEVKIATDEHTSDYHDIDNRGLTSS